MIIDSIYDRARLEPSNLALIHNDCTKDYLSFAKLIEAYRQYLAGHRLPPGTTAVVPVEHLVDAWCLVLALRSCGLTTIQVLSLAETKALALNNVSCVVTTAAELARVGPIKNILPGARLIAVTSEDLTNAGRADLPLRSEGLAPPGGHILYTSGTTGTPKKLLWDSALEKDRSLARARVHGFEKSTIAYTWRFSLPTSIGWKVPLSVWRMGGCVVFDQRPEWQKHFFQHRITSAFVIPSTFQQLLNSTEEAIECDILLSSGLTSSDYIVQGISQFGRHLTNYYGSTELNTPPLISRIDSPEDAIWLAVAPNRTVQIVDETGRECALGQKGALRILISDLDWRQYLEDPATSSKIFRDGFFYPGDLAVRRADGRIQILGRVADVLNLQGRKFAVGPLEESIRKYLNVNEVCVFSGLNAAGQDEIVAAIECQMPPDEWQLDAIRRDFKRMNIRFSVMKEFPRSESGKIRRAELRKAVLPI